MGNKNFTDVTKPSEIVQLLLNDEQLATLNNSTSSSMSKNHMEGTNDQPGGPVQDLWNDDEDNFFGHTSTANAVAPDVVDADTPIPSSTRGKKRKAGTTGATRGRKSTAARKNLEKGVSYRKPAVKESAT